MPLYKRKPFPLLENPIDLKPQELVFQVRFTKEIFRDYSEYLNRINLYRQRVWTCKVTGKSNLTFEEALVCERKAMEKVQQFPEELIVPVLREVQFSMLKLKDLVSTISAKLQECMLEGSELYGRKNNRIYPCKIVKVLMEEADKTQYQVAWLDKEKKVTGNAVVDGEDLIRKKLPFNRDVLKSFIRESTYRSVPWVLHDKLAERHGISTDPPEEIQDKICIQDGRVVNNRNRKKNEETNKEALRDCKRKNSGIEDDVQSEEPKYPIDDLLVKPAADDLVLAQRPSPSRDFNIPMDCVGGILMVWDFCSSFGRLLHLLPFSLEDFENALCHKESNLVLIVECHSALLRLLLKDNGEYRLATQKKKRKPKISLVTWTEFLCDFLEMIGTADFTNYISTIRRGHYGLLHLQAKMAILRELVAQALETQIFREKLDEYIEERQALAATNREEALAEGRKKREAKERKKLSDGMQANEGHTVGPDNTGPSDSVNYNDDKQNIDIPEEHNEHELSYSKSTEENSTSKKNVKFDAIVPVGSAKPSAKKGAHKLVMGDSKETEGKRSTKQRKEYLQREMEKRTIRTNPLGKDRYHNRYWFFRRDPRIYIESSDSTQWGYYSTKDELDSFMGSLNQKGEREKALKKQLENCYGKICSELLKRSKDRVAEEVDVRRSTRIRAPPRENPALAFLKYSNKWKED